MIRRKLRLARVHARLRILSQTEEADRKEPIFKPIAMRKQDVATLYGMPWRIMRARLYADEQAMAKLGSVSYKHSSKVITALQCEVVFSVFGLPQETRENIQSYFVAIAHMI